MSELVTELRVIGTDSNIFDTDMNYVIPLYQRAYAWEDKQLIQLVEDISDVSEDANYYIGSLIVSKQNGKYEVVDGQQRLTSLYLLLNCLGLNVKNTLTFACREKSNYTLQNIQELLHENRSKLDMDRIEQGIQRGIKILTQELNKENFDKELFLKKLSKVVVYRIQVPDNTDLNRYFEIMNTRGAQLEQHDILKATLMSYLPDAEKSIFAKIWDACSDMTGYVQMHFVSKNNELRESIFGGAWNNLPSNLWNDYLALGKNGDLNTGGQKISDITSLDFVVEDDEGYIDDDVRVRFESIIDYPFFLLHVLKVLVEIDGIKSDDPDVALVAELLDDKKLIDSFNRVISHGVLSTGKISENSNNKADFSRAFIICLLRTRFLFDKYIIKREYANENADGEWSLKSLYVSGQQSKKKPYYRNSRFINTGEWNTTNDWRTKSNIMIQSALRVSYTSPKVMHWITQLLIWLSAESCKHTCDEDMTKYDAVAEAIAQKAVKENFFDVCKDGAFAMGVNTPHIVFNYLDFLIWNGNRKKYDNFDFEFRNSVEHWYPQNPSEGTFAQWKDGVDQFGNLCIIQRNVNSKFSNMSPEAKKSTFRDMISKGSLKLRIMSELTEKRGEKPASLYWRETAYKQHEEEMLSMLMKACGIESLILFPDSEVIVPIEADESSNAKNGTNLNVASIMLEWAKSRELLNELVVHEDKCGKRYVRFTTALTSSVLPEAQEAASGWKTRTHYFYEIVNEQGKKIYMQFALSGENLPDDLKVICERINEKFPSRVQKTDWKWRCPFVSERVMLTEKMSKEDIVNILNKLYAQTKRFENNLVSEITPER